MPNQDELTRFEVAENLTKASALLEQTRTLLTDAIAGLPFTTNQALRRNLEASLERLDRSFFDFPHDLHVLYVDRLEETDNDRPPGQKTDS